MNRANLNDVWNGIVLDAIAAAGVRRTVLSPGGRSATTVLALHGDTRFAAPIVSTDERSGAYAALGMVRASGEPAAIITTSGSAVANVVPALTEAHECGLPLLLLSCDRPRGLRGSGFGQMTDHVGACQPFVHASADLPDPQADAHAFEVLANTLDEALAALGGAQPGPVHINMPLGGYFHPAEHEPVDPALVRAARALPAGLARRGPRRPDASWATSVSGVPATADLDALCAQLGVRRGMRAMVIAGPDCDVPPDTLREFVAAAGLPVLADTASGLRGTGLATVLNGHDALALPIVADLPPPELVIRFGLAPVMPSVQQYLLAHPCPTLKISRTRRTRDYLHPQFASLVNPGRDTLLALAHALAGGDTQWGTAWREAAREVAQMRNALVDTLTWGELPAVRTLLEHDGFQFVHVGNSMPIRHAELLYETRANGQAVYCNRGLSGIDGTLGTFIGEATARGDAGLLILGDLAFLHDMPALALAQRLTTSACICVINNGGGAIFDFLPLASQPHYDVAIRNAYAFDATRIAAGFGLPYAVADSVAALHTALDDARSHPGASVVEVRVPPGSALAGMRTLAAALSATRGAAMPA